MKFVRLAVVEFIGLRANLGPTSLNGAFGRVELHRLPVDPIDGRVPYMAIGISSQHMASVRDGELVIDGASRLNLEAFIESAASAVAVSFGCQRMIWSHLMCYALQPDSESDQAQLQSISVYAHELKMRHSGPWCGIEPAKYPPALMYRLEGADVMAECVSNTTLLGQYRECIRLFELAFKRKSSQLAKVLSRFLAQAPHGYARAEVEKWISMRDRAVHADKMINDRLAFTRDVQPYMDRMLQAAFEVLLFNKTEWHKDSIGRRQVWTPLVGRLAEGGVLGTPGHPFSVTPAPLDCFYVWPIWMGSGGFALPPGWWGPAGPPVALPAQGESA